jgi:hypothetical protein
LKNRKLKDNTEAKELSKSVKLLVKTKVPSKYVLLDKETGQVYIGTEEQNPYEEGFVLWREITR